MAFFPLKKAPFSNENAELNENFAELIVWKADINQPIKVEGLIIKKEKSDKLYLSNIQKLFGRSKLTKSEPKL
ncbi:unnamed protein product [Blepharisma stoltei]|uniref:Uncharacterized protein n=1 Tax=Blepharisma stoltei TaxID=1481888 RepID=A0AAU9JET9_9CILI|nr:unnamed protein product [Blepharisma stoltei]